MPRSTIAPACPRGIIFLLMISLIGAACGGAPAAQDNSTIEVTGHPIQDAPADPALIEVDRDGYDATARPLAHYLVRGIIVGTENYYMDWNSSFSPTDVSLIWGELAANDLYKKIDWSQSGRWYYWQYPLEIGVDNGFIIPRSCNIHIIPATENLETALGNLEEETAVELEGMLIALEAKKDGHTYTWRSSLSREDTGDGSCEVLYLTRMQYAGNVYQ